MLGGLKVWEYERRTNRDPYQRYAIGTLGE